MGLLRQNKDKIIIHPDDYHERGKKYKPIPPKSGDDDLVINVKRDNRASLKDEDDIVNNFIINPQKRANVRDEFELLTLEVKTIEDLEKFFDTVKGKRRVQVDPNRLAVKCPLCKINGKQFTNIMAFTQNINEIECCGVTYYK